MYCRTGIGPAIAMRRRISVSSGDVSHRRQACSGGRFSAATMKATPVSISGTDSSMPMVSPPQRKPSCAIGLAKQFADDPRDRIADREHPDDEARPLQRAAAHATAQSTRHSTSPSSVAS